MAEDSGQPVLAGLDEYILPLIAHIVPQLEAGIRVLDIGCGKGRVLMQLASCYPNSHFTAITCLRMRWQRRVDRLKKRI